MTVDVSGNDSRAPNDAATVGSDKNIVREQEKAPVTSMKKEEPGITKRTPTRNGNITIGNKTQTNVIIRVKPEQTDSTNSGFVPKRTLEESQGDYS